MTATHRRRAVRPTTPAGPGDCRCQPVTDDTGHTHVWPVTHAHHLGDAHYAVTRRHDLGRCGLSPEPVDLRVHVEPGRTPWLSRARDR